MHKICKKLSKSLQVLSPARNGSQLGAVSGDDDGIVGLENDVLFHVLALEHGVVVEEMLSWLAVLGAHHVDLFPLGVIADAAGFGQGLQDGEFREPVAGLGPRD